jgi:hypothetical protein
MSATLAWEQSGDARRGLCGFRQFRHRNEDLALRWYLVPPDADVTPPTAKGTRVMAVQYKMATASFAGFIHGAGVARKVCGQ